MKFPRERATVIAVLALTGFAWSQTATRPWKRHAIDAATATRRGADGVRIADANGDGRPDIVTGWEEGNAIRVCLHPGRARVREAWPAVTVGRVKSAEDAVFVDLDDDGSVDVVSCTEGKNRTVYIHWAPREKRRYTDETAWKTEAIPVTRGEQPWMFALPMQIDGHNGIDLVVGSKGKSGAVGWLRSPRNPRSVEDWRLHPIVDAGWIMSLRSTKAGAETAPIYVSDRRGKGRGVYRLRPRRDESGDIGWTRERVGGSGYEVMFLDVWPGSGTPVVATRAGVILDLSGDGERKIDNPFGAKHGKAVRIGDLDGDGTLDIVHTANTARSPRAPGVAWLRRVDDEWHAHDISGPTGSKFDRIELLDLDGDGDLDVITCEENAGKDSRGLGVIWYENPARAPELTPPQRRRGRSKR